MAPGKPSKFGSGPRRWIVVPIVYQVVVGFEYDDGRADCVGEVQEVICG